MPKDFSYDERLTAITRGYAMCVVAMCFTHDEVFDIDEDDFSDRAVKRMVADCKEFIDCVDEMHPNGDIGLHEPGTFQSVGWYLAFERMGLGVDFKLIIPGELGRELNELATLFDRIKVGLSADRKIVFLH